MIATVLAFQQEKIGYENDCLKAALEYNKSFYSDDDIKPEEELLFTLTIVPFSKISSTNINK